MKNKLFRKGLPYFAVLMTIFSACAAGFTASFSMPLAVLILIITLLQGIGYTWVREKIIKPLEIKEALQT
ncbi:hypothetical protein [Microbulbifer sp. THAF38]|uniref:hypothetical protein n=1 Tax=Microbulbifer sp. THAF38 TaxID=2587856 RepID=UPI001267A7DB|nr:hypothetical protein [Microbulbifer sp. THAF38]QFT57066.1 hypothetical protein FIU95_21175 [Microbulbifer sp. THAF38]